MQRMCAVASIARSRSRAAHAVEARGLHVEDERVGLEAAHRDERVERIRNVARSNFFDRVRRTAARTAGSSSTTTTLGLPRRSTSGIG